MKLNGAGSFLNFNNVQPEAIPVTAGHRHKAGSIVSFNDAGMLAQPTFIYWGNSSKPADMLIRFFENSAPYKTIRTLNRFEMEAFIQLAGTKQPQELLQLACSNGNNKMNRMQVKTTVKKRRQVHDVTLFENNKAVFSQQLFYNV